MIDLHTHVLPGLDDGARTIDEALQIARSIADDGVQLVAATPHVSRKYATTPARMEDGVASLRRAIDDADLDLEVLPGGEIALDRVDELDGETLARFGLGGNPRVLLIEFPDLGWPATLATSCERLQEQGFRIVIAHPERNAAVQARPRDLDGLVRAGALVQLTAASLDGRLGRTPARCARVLLDLQLAHLLSSDAHAPGVRQAGMSGAVKALGDAPLATWLTSTVPAALLADEALPPRPPRGRKRSLRRLIAR